MSTSSDVTSPLLREPLLIQPGKSVGAQNDLEHLNSYDDGALSDDGATSSSSGGDFNGATSTTISSVGKNIELHSAETTTSARGSDDLDGRGRLPSKVHWLDHSITPSRGSIHAVSGSFSSTLGERREHDEPATIWQSNTPEVVIKDKYEESALYIREGEDDAKFYHHPQDKWAKGAYLILHYQLYYFLHFSVCMLLLLLAFAENPSVARLFLNQKITEIVVTSHAVLELFFLTFLGMNVVLHAVWYRKIFLKQRILLISIILVVMYVEALTVAIRQQNHIRITRILRPLFLLDTHYMTGVRRVTRQIVQILKPILDVILLLIFFIILFSLFGYLIFAEIDPDFFKTFSISFVSLFITASSANNPDVMMEAYARHNATPIFYVVYLVITLYFASNVLLAVVFASFSEADKKKFKKLFCHKRDALLQAFYVLSEDNDYSEVRRVQFHDFLLMMQWYRPRIPEWQVMCIFKSLNKNPNSQYEGLDEEDFLRFYEVLDFRWTLLTSRLKKLNWYSNFRPLLAKSLGFTHRMVSHRLYKFIIGLIVFVNLIVLIVHANRIEDPTERFEEFQKVLPGTFVFLSIYTTDIIFNILGYGPYDYFRKFWSLADLAVISISLISACINLYHSTWAILLPLKLLRLIRLKRRYRDLMNTMVDLAPRLINVLVLILIIYYCFAIIGMEFLFDKLGQGCCKDALYDVGNYFSGSIDNVTSQSSSLTVFYILNFNNILRSYVTLFVLMVVNNWYITMEGFVSEVHTKTRWLTRLYFIMFYLITLVVVQVIIAFIVEAFVLKIQAAIKRRICHKHPDNINCGCPNEKKKKIAIKLVEEDIAKIQYEKAYMENHFKGAQKLINKYIRRWRQRRFDVKNYQQEVNLVGSRSHTKEDIHQIHYRDEIKKWREEKPGYFRSRSNLELEQLKKFKDKRNIRLLCRKVGNSVIDFVMD